ncbi:Meiosis-specific serine/threonine-protein kinase mek1 [Serendipita sp. 399]|nr:Meiosis-specific serine/threonine-protein kinase mek1 [Serendipita sp. 399]
MDGDLLEVRRIDLKERQLSFLSLSRRHSGAYSSVNLAIDHEAKRQVACKTIVRRTQADIEDVLKEVELLRKLRHVRILSQLSPDSPNINAVYGFESSGDNLHIFLELATGGDLFSYMAKYGSLCEAESKYIAFQLMKGLQYIHQLLISHRDLKPENVLLSKPTRFPRVVIADFGLAREQAYEPTANVAGTVSYLPPEAVDAITWKQKYSSESTDAWALGLIVFIMLK